MKKIINYYSALEAEDGFVGAKIFSSRVDFFFPLGMKFSREGTSENREKVLKILSIISLATASLKETNFGFNFERSESEPLGSYIWLINDYLENGFFLTTRKKFSVSNSGKINWRRTFRCEPIYTAQGSFYPEFVVEQISRENNLITKIQKYCLSLATEKIGWLYGLGEMELKEEFSEISENKKFYFERLILKELRLTFEDHKKQLLTHLLRILRHSRKDKNNSGRSEFGTYEFHYVWEKMIDCCFSSPELNPEDFFPNASWIFTNNIKEYPTSKLRPDTVMEIQGETGMELYILDAKYYKYGVLRDSLGAKNLAQTLPASGSVQKQITYGDFAAKRHGARFSKIVNAFIVPFKAETEEKFLYAGRAITNWRERAEEVHLLLLDTETLINLFLERKNSDGLRNEVRETVKNAGK